MDQLTGSDAVVAACKANWEAHKSDCSGFAKAVATDIGVSLSGMANDIVDEIQQLPWTTTMDGVEAAKQAEAGLFVIGGLKEEGHGHVVVITPGPLNRDKYPTAYWGRLGSVGMENTTINWAWNAEDRDNVIYGFITF
jgi:hypothetical protein